MKLHSIPWRYGLKDVSIEVRTHFVGRVPDYFVVLTTQLYVAVVTNGLHVRYQETLGVVERNFRHSVRGFLP